MKSLYLPFVVLLSFISAGPVMATNFYVGLNVGDLDESGDFDILNEELATGDPIVRVKDYDLPDGSELTYNLNIGYKLASDMFFELGFAQNDKIKGKIRALPTDVGLADRGAYEEYETNYLYAAFVGVWPLESNLAVSARFGFSVWEIDYTQYSADIPPTGLPDSVSDITDEDASSLNDVVVSRFSDNAAAMLFGLGLSYALDRNIEFKIGVETHAVDFDFENLDLEYDALLITAGAAYHF